MAKTINNLYLDDKISKKDLLKILKSESDQIHISDIMNSYVLLVEDGKYVQSDYQKEFLHAYIKGFLMRVKEVRNDKREYKGIIDKEKLHEAINNLKNQEIRIKDERPAESNFFKIYRVISLYTTFILEEPIHMVGTLFPGGFRVKLKGKTYYCPVKEKQKDNPGAVCVFCIAEQDEDV